MRNANRLRKEIYLKSVSLCCAFACACLSHRNRTFSRLVFFLKLLSTHRIYLKNKKNREVIHHATTQLKLLREYHSVQPSSSGNNNTQRLRALVTNLDKNLSLTKTEAKPEMVKATQVSGR